MSLPPSPDDPQALSLGAALASRIGAVAGVGGWALDLRSQVLHWDAETRRIHRVPADFVPTVESAIGFYAPEARPVIRAAVEACMRSGQSWDFELPLLRADGEPFWARVVGAADLVDGRPVRLLGAFQDITRQRAERLATEQARQQLALAMQSGRIGVWHVDPGSGGAVWDDWVFRQYGREPRPGLVMAREWAGWLHPEDRPRVLAAMAAAVAGTPQEGLEFRVLWPDGAVRHLRAAAHPVRDAEGRVLRVVGLNWDVTPERELEQALRAERGLLQVTLRSIGDAVATTDGEGRLRWLNPAAERLCGMAVAEAAGRPCAEVFALRLEEAATPFDAVARCLGEGRELHVEGQAVLQRRDGAEFAVELSVAPIRDDEGGLHGAVLVLHDVTEQRRLDREMRFRATHDALTGLPNREALEAELQRALEAATAEAQGSALAVIDLDQFKVVNDTCGHAAGDLLLRQVARLFVDTVRRRDFVARIGGDEFAIVLHHCTPEQAQRVAQLICDRLETWRFEHGGHRFRIGASIGIAPIDDRFPDLPAVVQAADSACLSAKEAGRNRVHLWRDSDGAISQRRGEMRWAARLERALDEGGFTLYHQHILPRGRGPAGRDPAAPSRARWRGAAGRPVPRRGGALPPRHPHRPLGAGDRARRPAPPPRAGRCRPAQREPLRAVALG